MVAVVTFAVVMLMDGGGSVNNDDYCYDYQHQFDVVCDCFQINFITFLMFYF